MAVGDWTTDTAAVPAELKQMQKVATLPVPGKWFASQGVPMRSADIEPGWPLLHGIVRTDAGPFMVLADPDDDSGVDLWALESAVPSEAVKTFADVMGHGATAENVLPDGPPKIP